MSAYILVEIDIHNPEEYEEYKKLTPATLAAYDGKFVIRGGQPEILEGNWNPERIILLEFPTVELARLWWGSVEYAPAKKIRQNSAYTKMILLEGFKDT